MKLVEFVKRLPEAEAKCRAILAKCENPNDPFPSHADEFDFAAYLYDKLSLENESYPQKAYTNALEAIKLGYHTTQNLEIVAEYSYSALNLVGLKQIVALIYDDKFCYRHTPNAGVLYNKIVKWVKELSAKELGTGFIIFTPEEKNEIFECCKHHLEVITEWEVHTRMEQDGIRHGYSGVREARHVLYNLDYEGINIGYDGCSSYYDDLKMMMSHAYRKPAKP